MRFVYLVNEAKWDKRIRNFTNRGKDTRDHFENSWWGTINKQSFKELKRIIHAHK